MPDAWSEKLNEMRILIISVGKMSGGIESYTLTMGKMLSTQGIEIFYALREGSWLDSQIKERKIKISMGKSIFSDMRRLAKYAEENKIDLVHCNSNNGLFIGQQIKKKKVGVIHGDVLVDQAHKGKVVAYLYSKLETWLINHGCDKCISVSESLKDILVSRGVKKEKITVIQNGIEIKKYCNAPDYNKSVLNICSVGNLLPVKNHIKLIEAIKIIKEECPDFSLNCDIYGEGAERSKLEKYILKNHLSFVSLNGYDANVRDKLNDYQLYIHPSLYESFGIAVLEAMNAGCCAIVNPTGGLGDIIVDDCGYRVDCTDGKKIAESIKYCFLHRQEMARIAQKGQERCKTMFSDKNMVGRVIAFYHSVVGE